jgi:hypothetical protein
MLKRDSIYFGIFIGLLFPAALYGILYLAAGLVETGTAWARPFEKERMALLSMVVNLILIRLYFVKWKMDKTGRGVLLITFILVILFFIFKKYL